MSLLFFSFLFFSRLPFFFFFWGCAVLLFSVLDIFLFLSDWCHICSSCFWPFFFLELSCVASFFFFFFFSFHAFLFFFFWGCAVLLFSVLDIFLFLSGGCRICSSCFWSCNICVGFEGFLGRSVARGKAVLP